MTPSRDAGRRPADRLRPLLATAKHEALRWSYVDRGRSVADTVLVAGTFRSGTTWVGEVLDRHHDHRIVFEPFRGDRVPEAAPFTRGLYLRPDRRDARYVEGAERIVSGRIRNRWADHHNRARLPRRRLIKEVRANNLLPWLAATFPEMAVVYLVRHPGAVAASAAARGWRDQLDEIVAQPDLVEDHLAPALAALGELRTPWERFVGQWCAENVAPLRMLGPARAHMVLYEELVADPEGTAPALLAHVGQEADPALPAALARPSRLTGAEGRAPSWVEGVTDEQWERAAAVLAACGLDAIWSRDPVPDGAAARAAFAAPWPSA